MVNGLTSRLSLSSQCSHAIRPTQIGAKKHYVTLQEVMINILNDESSWNDIRKEIKSAKLVTSLGVNEVCQHYIQTRKRDMQEQRYRNIYTVNQ